MAVCHEACAGRRIRWLRCLQRFCSAGCVCLQCLFCGLFCLPATFCLPCPLPFSTVCPRSSFALPPSSSLCFVKFISFCLPPVHAHVRQDHLVLGPAVCQLQDCPVGSCNTGLQWRPVHRVHLTPFLFLCRVHDPGPWVSVEYKVRCVL